ncbi:hypothetical protein SAVIM338S_00944 [Streptomyces avidinii]
MTEEWVTGLVNGILYNVMYHSDVAELGPGLARRCAFALREQPISPEPPHRQAAGLRAAVASDDRLASTFEPYPGQRPYGEAEFRAFLTLVADELDLNREAAGPGPTGLPDAPDARRPRGLRALLRRLR